MLSTKQRKSLADIRRSGVGPPADIIVEPIPFTKKPASALLMEPSTSEVKKPVQFELPKMTENYVSYDTNHK